MTVPAAPRHQISANDRQVIDWYRLPPDEAARQLETTPAVGLTDAEAGHRLERYGPNDVAEHGGPSRWQILVGQVTGIMTVVLVAAAGISVFLGDVLDAVVILAIVVLNAALGYSQEHRAEQSMAALKRLSAPMVRVRRGGGVREVTARELVPGDVVLLETGNVVPADGRLMQSSNLRVQEAALSGESEAAEVAVFARVSSEHKIRLVQAFQANGNVVAMTGDGVNDAPALKKADIGVAMGITGTDVSKEGANMVLLDDNFTTIVAAVQEGRVVYDNIRRFIKYLLTCNASEVAVMLIGPLLGMPLPLQALQIPFIVVIGVIASLVSIGVGLVAFRDGDPHWQTLLFTTLIFAQLAVGLGVRSERSALWTIGLFSNRAMLGAVLLTVVLQLAVVYVPPFQTIFGTTSMPTADLVIAALAGLSVLIAVEAWKWALRQRTRAPARGAEPMS